jgi:nucleotide-binding universal stress UspA family protein
MYRHLLVPLENSKADDFVLEHVQKLAHDGHAKISLIHVAHGHVARNQKQLNLAPSEEMQAGRQYVAAQRKALVDSGFDVTAHFASGEPSDEILAYAAKILADLVLGSVSDEVRHRTDIPVLLLRCPQPKHQRQHR